MYGETGGMAKLAQVLESDECKLWARVRNKLAHRAAPVRKFKLRAGAPGPEPAAEWYEGLRMDESLTLSRREWLARVLGELSRDAQAFAERRL